MYALMLWGGAIHARSSSWFCRTWILGIWASKQLSSDPSSNHATPLCTCEFQLYMVTCQWGYWVTKDLIVTFTWSAVETHPPHVPVITSTFPAIGDQERIEKPWRCGSSTVIQWGTYFCMVPTWVLMQISLEHRVRRKHWLNCTMWPQTKMDVM